MSGDVYICDGCKDAFCATCEPIACEHGAPLCGACFGRCADCVREARAEGSAA